jgi:ribosome-associated protein
MLFVGPRVRIPLREITFTFVRSSGPGGQNVNKVNSKAVLRWNARASGAIPPALRPFLLARLAPLLTTNGELVVACDEHRDQPRNRDACLDKLREILSRKSLRPKTRKTTQPTRSSKRRKQEGKRHLSNKKRLRGAYRGD